ncbi:MAG TPA: SurA N-terminal domain-containing protein [Candidatus Saccharimonadales bacterium]|nr:SurA N-terminal domain-containing protein [Candidatus Saccharimonadales bacterium]
MKKKIKDFLSRKKIELIETPVDGGERITNETVAAHREAMLGRARKYIYPLQHSKHRIVLVSTGLFIATVITFFSYCTLALYRFESSSTFLYRVTQVMPLPVARSGGHFIAYENYLFELRHYTHYYITQQKLDFNSSEGKQQLADFKRRALEKVINDNYIKQLAAQHKLSVSEREVDDAIAVVRSQNRLGASDKVFEDVLRDYWGWSLNDFKRSLRSELLAEKVAAVLDTDAAVRAQKALNELNGGADFAATAKKYSNDAATKDLGGEYGYPIDETSRTISSQATEALFKLKPGQHSGVVNTGLALEILKNIETNGDKIRAAHIVFYFKDINIYINDLKDKQHTRTYINV